MVFKKLLASLGSGGAKVDTVLQQTSCHPGGMLQGSVNLMGGDVDQNINHVAVGLMARVEVESGDNEYHQNMQFNRVQVAGSFVMQKHAQHSLPFQLPVPWEMPLSSIHGMHLHGMKLGVSTELDIAGAIDSTDLDAIAVHPLQSQQLILDAFATIGFRFKKADLERGHIRNSRQTLPFYQEIEFAPGGQWMGRINEIEVTFITGPQAMEVILEIDRRKFMGSTDSIRRFEVDHQSATQRNWANELNQMLQQLSGSFF